MFSGNCRIQANETRIFFLLSTESLTIRLYLFIIFKKRNICTIYMEWTAALSPTFNWFWKFNRRYLIEYCLGEISLDHKLRIWVLSLHRHGHYHALLVPLESTNRNKKESIVCTLITECDELLERKTYPTWARLVRDRYLSHLRLLY